MGVNKINLRFGGPAGTGIMQAGLTFSKACSRIGLHVFDYIEYPSLIRGGHNTYLIRAEDEPVNSHLTMVDVLIAFDEPTLTIHADELKDDSLVVYDQDSVHPERTQLKRGIKCPLPLSKLVSEAGGTPIMANTVALAAVLGILDYDFDTFTTIISDQFKGKKQEIIQQNITVARHGYDYAQKEYEHLSHYKLTKIKAPKRLVMTGNEAVSLGCIKAGMKFFAAYPMTPASSILHVLAAWQERHSFIVKHAEDEISVINMAVGAGYAGVRAACSTSGGGFALMNEAYSLAAIAEVPVVIFEVQRPGPATGMPTWTEQGDLQYVLHAGHGEFPRFVLAPGDVEEAYQLTIEAFNIAEKYQTPVILLSDKYLAESHRTMEVPSSKVKIERGKLLKQAPNNYLRYDDAADGISPRVLPGTPGGFHLCNSYEHDEFGWTSEDAEIRKRMVHKRSRKTETYRKEMPQPGLIGPAKAELTIISWGSNKGPIIDAMKFLANDGLSVNYLHLTHLAPFPAEKVSELLRQAKRALLIENNSEGQLGHLIREQTGIELKAKFLRYDGRPHSPEEIHDKIKTMLT